MLILLAPELYLVLRRAWSRTVFFVVLGGVLLADVRLPLLNADALFYYAAAAAIALSPTGRMLVEEGEAGAGRVAVGVGILLTAAPGYIWGLSQGLPAGFVFCRLLAVTGLWIMVPAVRLPEARSYMHSNFFLYATHFAVVRFINKAGAELLDITPAVPLVLFLLMPGIALLICTLVGKLLRRYAPGAWILLNGGR